MSLHDVNTYCRYRTPSAIVKAKVIMFVVPAGLLHFDVVGQQFADRGSKSLQVGYDRRVISMAENSISCKIMAYMLCSLCWSNLINAVQIYIYISWLNAILLTSFFNVATAWKAWWSLGHWWSTSQFVAFMASSCRGTKTRVPSQDCQLSLLRLFAVIKIASGSMSVQQELAMSMGNCFSISALDRGKVPAISNGCVLVALLEHWRYLSSIRQRRMGTTIQVCQF